MRNGRVFSTLMLQYVMNTRISPFHFYIISTCYTISCAKITQSPQLVSLGASPDRAGRIHLTRDAEERPDLRSAGGWLDEESAICNRGFGTNLLNWLDELGQCELEAMRQLTT